MFYFINGCSNNNIIKTEELVDNFASTEIIENVKNNKMRTPGELSVNNQKYVFVMNTKKKCRLDAQKAAELNGYSRICR